MYRMYPIYGAILYLLYSIVLITPLIGTNKFNRGPYTHIDNKSIYLHIRNIYGIRKPLTPTNHPSTLDVGGINQKRIQMRMRAIIPPNMHDYLSVVRLL